MKLVTAKEVKKIEEDMFNNIKMDPLILMEIAGKKVFNEVKKHIKKKSKVVVVCGPGNNGGDGFVVARYLHCNKVNVSIVSIGSKYTEQNIKNKKIAKNLNINMYEMQTKIEDIYKILEDSDIIVDAILGIGISRDVEGIYYDIIEKINRCSKYTISIDMPSGIDSDTGKILKKAVIANKTITFIYPKVGQLIYPGAEYVGQLITKNIQIPINNRNINKIKNNVLTKLEAKKMLPKRKERSNKGTYGKVAFIGGSKGMTGASVLSTKASYAVGTGLVKAFVTESVASVLLNNNIEVITKILRDDKGYICNENLEFIFDNIESNNILVLGPALGNNKITKEFVYNFLLKTENKIILDADALNVISEDTSILKKSKADIIITPHIKEMSRLTGQPKNYISENIIEVARCFAIEHNIIVVLKDAKTIIANPNGEIYINITGTSGMAKAGSGDVLTGIISGIASQGVDLYNSAILGCYINGIAGEIASKNIGKYSVVASNIIENIGKAIKKIEK